jgi:hypothetical protein
MPFPRKLSKEGVEALDIVIQKWFLMDLFDFWRLEEPIEYQRTLRQHVVENHVSLSVVPAFQQNHLPRDLEQAKFLCDQHELTILEKNLCLLDIEEFLGTSRITVSNKRQEMILQP